MSLTSYFFVFGRTPQLALKELTVFFPQAQKITDEVASVELSDTIEVSTLLEALGGTVKIAKRAGSVEALDGSLVEHLTSSGGAITFGVSAYGTTLPKTLLTQMKKELEARGVSARYITSRDGEPLTSVAIDKEHAEELIVIKTESGFIVGNTVGVQNYDAWSKRDYGRPRADAKSGMLPLKVSRMIVNIALSQEYDTTAERQKTLLDPFCGMGTVLGEAYMMGARVIGCDTSDIAISGAKENLSWLTATYPSAKGAVAKLFVGDATHVSETLASQSVHAIVTEPFMGSTDIANKHGVDPEKVRNIIKGLEKLYIGCLRDWHKILVSGGKIVIALPAYAISGRTYFVKKVVDMCEILGYTIVDGPIEYSRPQAVVKRQFYILEKK